MREANNITEQREGLNHSSDINYMFLVFPLVLFIRCGINIHTLWLGVTVLGAHEYFVILY